MLTLTLGAVCTFLLVHLHRHDAPAWAVALLSLVPLALAAVLGLLGILIGGLYTASLARVDLSAFGAPRQQGLVRGRRRAPGAPALRRQ